MLMLNLEWTHIRRMEAAGRLFKSKGPTNAHDATSLCVSAFGRKSKISPKKMGRRMARPLICIYARILRGDALRYLVGKIAPGNSSENSYIGGREKSSLPGLELYWKPINFKALNHRNTTYSNPFSDRSYMTDRWFGEQREVGSEIEHAHCAHQPSEKVPSRDEINRR